MVSHLGCRGSAGPAAVCGSARPKAGRCQGIASHGGRRLLFPSWRPAGPRGSRRLGHGWAARLPVPQGRIRRRSGCRTAARAGLGPGVCLADRRDTAPRGARNLDFTAGSTPARRPRCPDPIGRPPSPLGAACCLPSDWRSHTAVTSRMTSQQRAACADGAGLAGRGSRPSETADDYAKPGVGN